MRTTSASVPRLTRCDIDTSRRDWDELMLQLISVSPATIARCSTRVDKSLGLISEFKPQISMSEYCLKLQDRLSTLTLRWLDSTPKARSNLNVQTVKPYHAEQTTKLHLTHTNTRNFGTFNFQFSSPYVLYLLIHHPIFFSSLLFTSYTILLHFSSLRVSESTHNLKLRA